VRLGLYSSTVAGSSLKLGSSFNLLADRLRSNIFREDEVQVSLLWLALGLAVVTAIGRGFWLYRASLTWPTADGVITRLDVDRQRDTNGGHYFRATFSYDFRDPQGHRV